MFIVADDKKCTTLVNSQDLKIYHNVQIIILI